MTIKINKILCLPIIKDLITGRNRTKSIIMKTQQYADLHSVRKEIADKIYESMIDCILQSVENTTRDIREIIRLSRKFWPSYIKPIFDDPSIMTNIHLARDKNVSVANSQTEGFEEILYHKARSNVRQLLTDSLLCLGNGRNVSLTCPNSQTTSNGALSSQNKSLSFPEKIPYITKFMLLAAYLCQCNKSDHDTALFTNQRTGRGKRRRSITDKVTDHANVTHATSTLARKELLKKRVSSFPLERLLSVFSSIVSKYGTESLILQRHTQAGFIDLRQMGTTILFESLAQLQQFKFIQFSGSNSYESSQALQSSHFSMAKFTCTLTHEEAQNIATSVGFPLSKYLFNSGLG